MGSLLEALTQPCLLLPYRRDTRNECVVVITYVQAWSQLQGMNTSGTDVAKAGISVVSRRSGREKHRVQPLRGLLLPGHGTQPDAAEEENGNPSSLGFIPLATGTACAESRGEGYR